MPDEPDQPPRRKKKKRRSPSDGGEARPAKAATPAKDADGGSADSKKPEPPSKIDEVFEQFFAYAWIVPVLGFLAAVAASVLVGLAIGILIAAGTTLLIFIGLFWNSLQSLSEESPLTLDDALTLGAPSAEEERKRAVLRALKDLEYERTVGKISEEDYRDLSAHYRAEAKALLRVLDGENAATRERAEKLLRKRLRAEGLSVDEPKRAAPEKARQAKPLKQPMHEPVDDEPVDDEPVDDEPVDDKPVDDAPVDEEVNACPACHTPNDLDARFCKKCGASMDDDQELDEEEDS